MSSETSTDRLGDRLAAFLQDMTVDESRFNKLISREHADDHGSRRTGKK